MRPAASLPKRHLYEFDSFILDETERTLLRGGTIVPLTLKALDLLLALVSNAGRVMEKEELMERVWSDAFVEEANLAVNISMLRKALGERPRGGQYIETIPRRGYRFAAEVKEVWDEQTESKEVIQHPESKQKTEQADAASSGLVLESTQATATAQTTPRIARGLANYFAKRKRLTIIILTLAVIPLIAIAYLLVANKEGNRATAQMKRLAVLPFKNQKPDEETDFLGFSLADSVINKLGYVKSLVVRPSSYVQRYAGQEQNPAQIAQELDVNTLLMGSYIKDGNDLRVNAQLVDVASGEKLWSETIDVRYDRLLQLQDYVARQVVKGLRLNLTASEDRQFNRSVSDNPVAYEYFLRSRYLMSTSNHRKAIELLEKSVELDPNNALAWAYLGRAYNINALQQYGGREDYVKAEAAFEQSLALDPQQPQARLMEAKLFTETGRVAQSAPMLIELVKANPNMAEAHWELSYAYRYAGMLDESIAEGERALQLDTNLESHLFNSHLYAGRYEKFLSSLPLYENDYVMFYRGLGYYYMSEWSRAAAAFERASELNPSTVFSQIGKAFRQAIAGNAREGIETLKAAEAQIEKGGVGDGEITYKFAQAYSALGDKEAAIRALDRSIEQGFFCYPYFASDPLLRSIRSEPACAAALEKARKRHEDFKRTLEAGNP
ncbi:MAG TPA: winged helix-turn-helix domain-containing protein [Blastocatellia bacterium]|nr:winged helix-turn-helix domain-containing protein [Blastocatellia bacterium]